MCLLVFGCTCFVYDVFSWLDKLSARAINVFSLGALIFRNGIDVILQSLRGYACADVTFEETLYFSSFMQDSNSIQ